jgi:plasmid stabilization system protein ParE
MSEVEWLPEALADVERLHKFIKPHNPEAASRAALVIRAGGDRLQTSPQLGRPIGDGTPRRELFLPFAGGAYVLRYILEHPDKAVITRVWHEREDRLSPTSHPTE